MLNIRASLNFSARLSHRQTAWYHNDSFTSLPVRARARERDEEGSYLERGEPSEGKLVRETSQARENEWRRKREMSTTITIDTIEHVRASLTRRDRGNERSANERIVINRIGAVERGGES